MRTTVGQRFGQQVVLRELGGGKVEVKCDCGTIKTTRKQYLLDGQSRSCGCGRRRDRSVAPVNVGDRFHALVVLEKLGPVGSKRGVLVQCDCGQRKVVFETDIRSGSTKSCGCLRRQRTGDLQRTHGEAGRAHRGPVYRTWMAIWDRTEHKEAYAHVDVWDGWRSFEPFRDYVAEHLGPRPPEHSIDRIDNSRGYEPGNIRWATGTEQQRNTSANVFVVVDGVSRCLAEWAQVTGITPEVINNRLRRGWPPERAVTEPARRYARKRVV